MLSLVVFSLGNSEGSEIFKPLPFVEVTTKSNWNQIFKLSTHLTPFCNKRRLINHTAFSDIFIIVVIISVVFLHILLSSSTLRRYKSQNIIFTVPFDANVRSFSLSARRLLCRNPKFIRQRKIYATKRYKPQKKGISCWSLNSINFVLFVSERIPSRKQISISPRLQLN